MDVFLHEVEIDNGETLYLVTTLGISAEHAAEFCHDVMMWNMIFAI